MLSGILVGILFWVGTVIFCYYFFTPGLCIASLIVTSPLLPVHLLRQAKIRKDAGWSPEDRNAGSWREDLVRTLRDYRNCLYLRTEYGLTRESSLEVFLLL